MFTSLRDFKRGLYAEHLEEGGFLHGQRHALLLDEATRWGDLRGIEDRLEAHLDALVVGGQAALDTVAALLDPAEPGLVFMAAALACRLHRSDVLAAVLRRIDFTQAPQVAALSLALKWELPAAWTTFVERALLQGDARLVGVLAEAVGYRRLPMGRALAQALTRSVSAPVLTALGKLRVREAVPMLEACLSHPDATLRTAALQALLQLGVGSALAPQYLAAQAEKWPRLALPLGGSQRAATVFIDIVRAGRGTPESLLALGLLGEVSALRLLYECLDLPECAEAAALAMNWITGANLYEQVFVPDAVREDELFDHERAAWRAHGQTPLKLDGTPFGQKAVRLSTSRAVWGQWWAQHQGRFDPALRYRSGEPYGPGALCRNLADPLADRRLRTLAALELQIRYGCDIAFEPDMPVKRQRALLGELQTWAAQADARSQLGAWTLNGMPA